MRGGLMTRRRSGMLGLLAGIVLLAGLVGGRPALGMPAPIEWVPGRSTEAGLDSAGATPAVRLGQALFLLGPLPEGAALPAGLPATAHARLALPGGVAYVASGPADAADRVAAAGVSARLLDGNTAGKVYYFLDAAAGDARGVAEAAGAAVLYAGERELLVGLQAGDERRLLDEAAAGTSTDGRAVALALLPTTALAAVEQPLPGRQPAAAESVDPTVANLLPLVTHTALYQRIGELSGVYPAPIGAGSVSFYSRYTWGGQIGSVEQYLYQFYASRGLAPHYVTWTYGSYSGYNVVADIPGSQHPERIWLIGGHFDSNSDQPYSSAPGADDNASGLAATMVIADLLRGYQFADTIRFVHFGAEEQGMWGSRSYVANLSALGGQVMGYIDLDMIGWDSNGDRVVEVHPGTGTSSNNLAAAFISANTRYAQGLSIELKGSSASRFSDHSSFWDYGYPAFLGIENFYNDTIPADRNPYYHKTGDTLSRVNLDYLARYTRSALATIAEQAGIYSGTPPSTTPTATSTSTFTPTSSSTPTPAESATSTATLALTSSPTPSATASSSGTATASPTGTAPPSVTMTNTPTQAPCNDLISNGGFEMSDAWRIPVTAYSAGYSTAVVHSGSRSLRTGIVSGSDVYSYSSADQTVTIPTGASGVSLRLWWYPISAESPLTMAQAAEERPASDVSAAVARGDLAAGALAGDRQYVLLLDANGNTLKNLMWTLASSPSWQEAVFDLSAYAGRTVRVHVGTYNDGNGLRSVMYVDDVSLVVCPPGSATSTATPSPSPTPIASATPTASTTATPTATSTPTEHPGPVRLRVAPRASSREAGELLVLELLVDAKTQPVNSVEIALEFDPALLEVVDAAGNPADQIDGDPGALGRVLSNHVDNSSGRIEYDAAQELPPASPPTGTFRVASVRFKVLTTPSLGQVRYLERSDAFYTGLSLVTGREVAWILGPGRELEQLWLPMLVR